MDPRLRAKRLLLISIVLFVGAFFELAGGILFGSLALMSDAYQMFVDSAAFIISYLAETREQGFLQEYGQYINASLLFLLSGYILWMAYQRLIDPVSIEVVPTVAVGFVIILLELLLLFKLKDHKLDKNEKGGYYHLISDISGTVGVITGAIIIYFTNIVLVDTIIAVLFAGFMVRNGIQIIKQNR